MKLSIVFTVLAAFLACYKTSAADQKLGNTDLLAICGDSITEQRIYSVDIEDYLVMCRPAPGARAEEFGWGGETSWGFHDKMPIFTLPFKPTVATTVYGMNDGGYSPMNPDKEKHYRDSQTAVVETLKKSGVKFIVLGSPGVVDSDTFRNSSSVAAMYNQTLGALRDIDRDVAQKEGVVFADLHEPMMDVMGKAKEKYGKKYVFAGPDGVHPHDNGHLVMAYALLKGLGFDGNIGTITVDLSANKADATDGHKIVSCTGGAVTVESSRYPFCFYGDPAGETTRSVIDFFPFNKDLNRFMLVVTNPGADQLKVTWGSQSRQFSAADLEKGINLAEEFLDNPFSKPFLAGQQIIQQKQYRDTGLIKNLYFPVNQQAFLLPDCREQIASISRSIESRIDAGATADREAIKPVTHTITIEAVK